MYINTALSASPATLDRKLAEFRVTHPPRRVVHRGVEWRYYAGGHGDQVMLRLTGALGLAEFSFQQISLFEPQFRVIAPDYPPVRSLAEMNDGLLAILDAEGVERAHVSGGSFGGMLAQVLVRRAPERIASLVLSHTGAPDGRRRPAGVARIGLARIGLAIIALTPAPVLRALLKARLGRTLDGADPFWRRYFDDAVDHMSKADIMSRVRLQAEFAQQRDWGPDDLARWPGRVLIIEGEDDPLFPPAARERLRALYPAAQVHTFQGTGHAAAVLKAEEYAAVVTRFVLQR